jgi:methyltransferase
VRVDFKNEQTVQTLGRLLLLEDFGLKITFPSDYLIPRIPQRLNYILLLEDILVYNDIYKDAIGLDIGEPC